MIDLPPPAYEQTIEAISKCGIARASISITYEDYLQSDEITISDLGSEDDVKLGCLKAAVHPFYILTIRNQQQQLAFVEYSQRVERPEQQAKALAWVKSNGLASQVPSYSESKDLGVFIKSLEKACSLEEGSTLQQLGESTFTIRREIILDGKFDKIGQVLECSMNLFIASDATERGISFGLIGNEAFVEENKR